jgi:ATP-dependent Lon protease
MRRVIAPELNQADVDEIPAHLRADLEFTFVSHIGEVLDAALEPVPERVPTDLRAAKARARRRSRQSPERRAARSR